VERHWKVLLLISVGSFAAFLDAPVVSVAFPAIHGSFKGSSTTALGWVLDGYFVAFATLPVFAGRLADRYGRDRVFLASLAAFTVASVLAGMAPSVGFLIAARAAQGLAAGCMYPAGQSLMLVEFPPERRKMALGVLAAVVGLAIAISPAIGGVIVHGLGWRWIFYINLILGVGALLFGMRLLRRDIFATSRTAFPDALGALLQGLGVGLLVLVILKYHAWGLTSAQSLAAIAVAAVVLPVFVIRSSRHPSPVIDLKLFRDRTFAHANVASLIFSIALFGNLINSVLFMSQVWGYSLLKTGLALAPGGLIGALVGGPAGRVAEVRGPRVVAVVGSLIAALGLVYIVLLTGQHPNYLGGWLPGQIIYGAGATAAVTALLGAALTAAPAEQYGNASGINLTFREIGGAIGVALAVTITSATAGTMLGRTHTFFVVAAVAAGVTALEAVLLARPRVQLDEQAQAAEPVPAAGALTGPGG
jgi:EmrB/QacA subfamily drug resistance transporter